MRSASSNDLSQTRLRSQRGSVTVWVVVLFVPVLLGMAGFALDLGMLYSAKGELKTAAGSAPSPPRNNSSARTSLR